MTQAVQQRLLDILEYWHQIEFFIPFDLKQVTDTQDDWTLRWLDREELASLAPDYFAQLRAPEDRDITGFRLYPGVFGKAEIAQLCATALPARQDAADMGQQEQEQRGGLDGRSCFARVSLNAYGEPVFDQVSVSTVPWALGRVAGDGLASLGLGAFEAAKVQLQDRLRNFTAQRVPLDGTVRDLLDPRPLSGTEMLSLNRLFADWAGFAPDGTQPLMLLEIVSRKKRSPPRGGAADSAPPEAEDDDAGSDEAEAGADPAIDILNSFYIEDLERAMRALRNGETLPLLASYLTPLARDERIDLYTDAGRAELMRLLHPDHVNPGHWFDDAGRSMSLMQQFAINACLEQLASPAQPSGPSQAAGQGQLPGLEGTMEQGQGLFSVNGPPGTGKTTLLRELFADNIVRRAAVLAGLGRAGDAFTGRQRIGFVHSTDSATVGCLRPELAGFEMVVASSNNAAVENISRDLPKRSQLDAEWADIGYLQTVAQRVAAEDDDGNVRKLAPGDQPWGLISCALGNRKNRRRFGARLYSENFNRNALPDPACQNIRQWAASYRGPGFAQAAAAYRAAAELVERRSAELALCADLWTVLAGQDAGRFCGEQQLALAAADSAGQAAVQAHEASQHGVLQLQAQLAELAETERLLDRAAPGFWARLFGTAAARRHRAGVVENADAQRGTRAALALAMRRQADSAALCAQTAQARQAADIALASRRQEWDSLQAELADMAARLAVELPAGADELERDAVQIRGLWHDAALSRMRSGLLASALALHEAWLAEVVPGGGGFGGNLFALSKLLQGQRPDVPAHAQLIWQSLFMVVPVVSTTFASLARQFADLEGGSLGWLFIDEAGQAVPQAAVGALWRARRAVVVGDPRQIEPVFTVPLNLIRALSALSPATAGEDYAPDKVSVQRLADQANRHGTLATQPGTPGLWIGSPLRVHRRCAEPMFSLSNAIAYEGKMVSGLPGRQPPAGLMLGDSAWIQLTGSVAFKQVVPRQIAFMVALLLRLYARDGRLPDAYLISPFKAVRQELVKGIGAIDWTRHVPHQPAPKRKALRDWCKERVGTVHTFQGKEQDTVFMVLGADAAHAGAAAWAASRPNLLNVALTRARHHFYMVGDAAVWRGLPYFSDAAAALPPVGAQAFIERIG